MGIPRRWSRCLLPLLTLSLVITGCGAVATPSVPPAAAKAAEQVAAPVVAANVRYSLDLLQARWQEAPDQNHFLSPLSAQLVLALTANGARGETQAAMQKSLALDGLPLAQTNRELGALQSILAKPGPKVETAIANAIWYKEGFQVQGAFQSIARDDYRAVFAPAPFGQPAAAKAINDWTKQATKGRIPSIIDKTFGDDRMYLLNAIYFNGEWQFPFEKSATRPEPFHGLSGTSPVPMMSQHRHYRYLETPEFQAVALPYGEGRLSLYVVLPAEGAQVGTFLTGITAEKWQQWMGAFADREGTVMLPKLKLEASTDLKPAMTRLGMGIAFDPGRADFSGLLTSPEPLYISLLKQNTFLQIDERGTEAAAATVVGIAAGSAAPQPGQVFTMVVNRPYLLAIRDDQTGGLLFVGTIVEPKAP